MKGTTKRSVTVDPGSPLQGDLRPIGDKSLTHRAVIMAGIARGRSTITHPNPGEDCAATARAIASLGARVDRTEHGFEIGGAAGKLTDPEEIVDLGNGGTGIRLMTGLIAGQSLYAVLTGDASLRKRPMRRIAEPLARMGVTILLRDGEYPPIAVKGGEIRPLDYKLPVASAQVKSCLMLAALGLKEGVVALEEPGPSRDHTERIFDWLGKPVSRDRFRVEIKAPVEEHSGFDFAVPSDMSSSAFYLVAGSIQPSSELTLESVNLNPTRSGVVDALRAMGADLLIEEDKTDSPEPVGSIRVRPAALKGTVIDGPLLVRAIDEVPVLAVAAMVASGETLFRDARELRVKESDRIESTASLVRALGGEVETGPDWMRIKGIGHIEGGRVESRGDHRIAMSALVAGCASRGPVVVDDTTPIATSDPTFLDTISRLGARLR